MICEAGSFGLLVCCADIAEDRHARRRCECPLSVLCLRSHCTDPVVVNGLVCLQLYSEIEAAASAGTTIGRRTHNERIALCSEDLDGIYTRQWSRILSVSFDDSHGVIINREVEVSIASHREKTEPVAEQTVN